MLGLKGNAIVRGIRVECHPDHFVLLASGAAGKTEVFGFTMVGPSLEKATLQLAAAIRERVERWGPALPGGRWEPQLRSQSCPTVKTDTEHCRKCFVIAALISSGGFRNDSASQKKNST